MFRPKSSFFRLDIISAIPTLSSSGHAASECLDADCDKGSVLLKTINGGDTWTKTFFHDYNRILSLKFFDPLNGIAIIHKKDIPNSRNAYVATTSAGGSNWNLLDLEIKRYWKSQAG